MFVQFKNAKSFNQLGRDQAISNANMITKVLFFYFRLYINFGPVATAIALARLYENRQNLQNLKIDLCVTAGYARGCVTFGHALVMMISVGTPLRVMVTVSKCTTFSQSADSNSPQIAQIICTKVPVQTALLRMSMCSNVYTDIC